MNLQQISNTTNTRVTQMHQIGTLSITFDCDAALVAPVGTCVKLDSAGKAVVATATEKPIGIVHIVKNQDHSGYWRVGILTEFKADIIGVAATAINAGTPLSVHSVTATAIKYKAAVAGDYVVAVALETAAANADIRTGCLNTSYMM